MDPLCEGMFTPRTETVSDGPLVRRDEHPAPCLERYDGKGMCQVGRDAEGTDPTLETREVQNLMSLLSVVLFVVSVPLVSVVGRIPRDSFSKSIPELCGGEVGPTT